ncbi:unnamed protein product, partial [Laminaria digitata]
IQVASVCLGIDHMIKRQRMGRIGSRAAASFGTTHARTTTTTTTTTAAAAKVAACHDREHLASCRLCLSTRRVLSIARAHGKRRHRDGSSSSCGACGVWAKVMDRCASLGIVSSNGTAAAAWLGDGSNGQILSVGVGGKNGSGGGGKGGDCK